MEVSSYRSVDHTVTCGHSVRVELLGDNRVDGGAVDDKRVGLGGSEDPFRSSENSGDVLRSGKHGDDRGALLGEVLHSGATLGAFLHQRINISIDNIIDIYIIERLE